VRPPGHWTHWDAEAERVHGISRELLARHGRDAAEVARMLNADLAGQTVYCDGWAHDFPWLALLFDEAGQAMHFRLESVARLFPDARLSQLDQARREAVADLGLSARAHDKVLRVARTVADLDCADALSPAHVSEAINYRLLDRGLWQ
jgi:hypothetical protein